MNYNGEVVVRFSDPIMVPDMINSIILDKLFTLKVIDNNSDEVYVRRFNKIFNQKARSQALNTSPESDDSVDID